MSFMSRMAYLLIMFFVLAACGQGASEAAPQQKGVPMGDKVHVLERRGKFSITPTTLFCLELAEPNPSLKKLGIHHATMDGSMIAAAIVQIGQSDYIGGQSRVGYYSKADCPDNGQNITIHSALTMNASGKPYRIELLARQGTAVIRRAIERLKEEDWPPYIKAFGEGPKEPIMIDTQSLSKLIIADIFEGSSR